MGYYDVNQLMHLVLNYLFLFQQKKSKKKNIKKKEKIKKKKRMIDNEKRKVRRVEIE